MGYSISIGEWEKPRKGTEDTVGSVTPVHLEEAPAFGEPPTTRMRAGRLIVDGPTF